MSTLDLGVEEVKALEGNQQRPFISERNKGDQKVSEVTNRANQQRKKFGKDSD